MKKNRLIILIPLAMLFSCTARLDNNEGGQSSQDMPSNRDNQVPDPKRDTTSTFNSNINPNNGTGDTREGIQGQSGNNQTMQHTDSTK